MDDVRKIETVIAEIDYLLTELERMIEAAVPRQHILPRWWRSELNDCLASVLGRIDRAREASRAPVAVGDE